MFITLIIAGIVFAVWAGFWHVVTWCVLALTNAVFSSPALLAAFQGLDGGIDFWSWKILALAVIIRLILMILRPGQTTVRVKVDS